MRSSFVFVPIPHLYFYYAREKTISPYDAYQSLHYVFIRCSALRVSNLYKTLIFPVFSCSKMFGIKASQHVLMVWSSPVNAEELQTFVGDLKVCLVVQGVPLFQFYVKLP